MKTLIIFLLVFLLNLSSHFTFSQNDNSFTIVYNNVSFNTNLEAQWGYSAWIEKGEKVILFDTGTKAQILLENLKRLKMNLSKISLIVISHEHLDHTGGLEAVLKFTKDDTKVYLPNDFKPALRKKFSKINFIVNDKFREIDEGVWLTKIFVDKKRGIKEQAIVLEKGENVIMITGCAHPGITEMCESIRNYFPNKKLELVTGGFHLMGNTNDQVAKISDKIKQLGFQKVAPSHCTGENSIAVFQKKWGDNYVNLNLGDTYYY